MTLVRAAQEQTATKEQVLANQEGWEGYDNRPSIKTFRPLIAEDNVVYAAFELSEPTVKVQKLIGGMLKDLFSMKMES